MRLSVEGQSLLPSYEDERDETARDEKSRRQEESDIEPRRKRGGFIVKLLFVAYTVGVTVLAVVLLLRGRDAVGLKESTPTKRYVQTPLGQVPVKPVEYKVDEAYVDLEVFKAHVNGTSRNAAVKGPWESLQLEDNYWIQLPTKDFHGGLPAKFFSTKKEGTRGFVPALHHQLHCIVQLKSVVLGLNQSKKAHDHATHCLELIRQALMCNADLTLEKPSYYNDDGYLGPDGFGTTHECMDWNVIHDLIEKNGILHEDLEPDMFSGKESIPK